MFSMTGNCTNLAIFTTELKRMSEFDIKAGEWDKNRMHRERAEAVAGAIMKRISPGRQMSVMEYGAGTGLLSFLLKDHVGSITMIDNSEGMVGVLRQKIEESGSPGLKVLMADLEKEDYTGEKFDLICTLMVMHHVNDVELILRKFSAMLRPGGWLAIADLYAEDGSFHGHGFTGHRGFDTGELAILLERNGFGNLDTETVYSIDRITPDNDRKKFDVFLMTAVRR